MDVIVVVHFTAPGTGKYSSEKHGKKKKRRERNEQTGKIYSDDYRGEEWGRGK